MAGSAAGSAPCKGLAHSPLIIAGARLGDMPDVGLLARTLADGDDPLSDTQEDAGSEPAKASHQLIPTGPGLPALPKKVVERIHAGEYIDFSELPPAKGKVRPLHQGLDGQVILVQAQDLLQSKKLIQDLPTWVQCFAVYVAVVVQKQPERVADLMAYATSIAKASKKYRWPSWVVYDQNFRQEAVSSPAQPWSKIDPSIYSQCFLGMARSTEGWCQTCQSLDHATLDCPTKGTNASRKRPWQGNTEKHPARSARSSTTTTVIAHSARDAAMLMCATDARVATP